MTQDQIYQNIAQRTGGDIYIGVVGPVRSGKSSFIKRFAELMLLPRIKNEAQRARAKDELPQSAAGRTIMTTEPKFIPEKAVSIDLKAGGSFRARLIDCVGYMVDVPVSAAWSKGTAWSNQGLLTNRGALFSSCPRGTRRVIREHATIGLVVTTDGSVAELPREKYLLAERRIIAELDEIGKPYLILLNCTEPDSEAAHALAAQMEEVYHHPVCPINAVNLTAEQLNNILQKLLYEFPLREIAVSMPSWVTMLEPGHWLQSSVYQALLELAGSVHKMGDMTRGKPQLNCANTTGVTLTGMDLACGQVQLRVGIEPDIFFKILGEETDLPITDEASLLPCMLELAKAKAAYDKIKSALEQVQATGYGIVMPGIEELHLEEPEIVRQGGQYGVRLSASAPSLHLMRATIHTELSPSVGSEEQGETLIQGLLKDFESDPSKLWSTNIFGKSLNELVNEGLQAKLMHMPAEARTRLQQTLERIINDGCDGLICILL